MACLSKTSAGAIWLKQFKPEERDVAAGLIDELLLVSRDDFSEGLDRSLKELSGTADGEPIKIALYAERPIKKVFGTIPAYFPNSRHGRALGSGAPPIVVDPRDQEVGSEGVVAQFITDYCRRNSSIAFSHPGPTKMRKERVRLIVIVTDFIGSGHRIQRMLEAFRYVATLRSWRAYGLVRFVIVAYAGTDDGVRAVRAHKLRPEVKLCVGCPTISNTFFGTERSGIEALCRAYPNKHEEPFGYDDSGALIAFAHGCPNNVPPLIHSKAFGWHPLFVGRSTTGVSVAFPRGLEDQVLDQRAQRLLRMRDARKLLTSLEKRRWVKALLILGAAERGDRKFEAISSRTHLSIHSVSELVKLAKSAGWLTDSTKLTPLGRKELARLRKRRRRAPLLPNRKSQYYYPMQLRAP